MTSLPNSPMIGIITQARTTSTRLPRKVLLKLDGRTVLDHHLDRLTVASLPVIVATTTNSSDDEVAALVADRDVLCFRGSETDVLSRFHSAAERHGIDVVVRVTSDCPLVDGGVVAEAVQTFVTANDTGLYLSNTLQRTYPRGFDVEVFSAAALAEANRSAGNTFEREHVTPYLYRGAGRLRTLAVTRTNDKSDYRITLDTPDDLQLIRALIEDHGAQRMTCDQIVSLLDAHPELVALNAQVEQKQLHE